jgi:branched-chain amino acid transport system ATP-binding protein
MPMQEQAQARPILSMNSVEVLYDNVMLAIKGVSVQVPKGEMIALLGSNGAGKSTTLKAISGLLKAEMGICHVIEGRRIFEHLTPDENLTAAAPKGMTRSALNAEKEKIYTYFPRLAERRNSQAGYLSGGEQQMLAIGRALVTQPSLLMLDEPSLGLAPFLVEEIFGILQKINHEEGLSVLLVEQNALAALEIVSEGYLIENGRVVMHGTAEALKSNSDIQEFYLGGGEGTDFHNVKHYSRRKRWLS